MPISKAAKKSSATIGKSNIETAVGETLVAHKDGSEEETSEEVKLVAGEGPFANVGVQARTTINLGNYENIQIQVSVHVPAEPTEQAITGAYLFAAKWVDERMQELVDKYKPEG